MEYGKLQLHDQLMRDGERDQLLREIRQAFRIWKAAQMQFDYALGDDEVDYSIYMLKASETQLSMLLNKAKEINLVEYEYAYMNWSKRGGERG